MVYKSLLEGAGIDYSDIEEGILSFIEVYISEEISEVDIKKRKEIALKQSGATDEVRKEILNKTEKYKELLTLFFRAKNSTKFEYWISLKEMFHNHTAYIRKDLDEDDAEKIVDRQLKIAKELDGIRDNLTKTETSLFGNTDIARDISEKETLEGYAEKYAELYTV